MQTVKKFSGSTIAPKKSSTFDFTNVSDGNIYKAVQGADYTTHKGFLVALTRYANGNDFAVNRYVAPEGAYVEFQLVAKTTAEVVAEDSASTDSAEQF